MAEATEMLFPPSQVNVTVTPSLPPTLSEEIYLCHFRESEGSIEFNTSAVSEDGRLYTCFLNGSVPRFEGAKLGNLIWQLKYIGRDVEPVLYSD